MNLDKRSINRLNKAWDKAHAPVQKEWNYLESESKSRADREKRTEHIMLAIILLMLIGSIVATRLLKYYDVLG